jgi:hypothetical protein
MGLPRAIQLCVAVAVFVASETGCSAALRPFPPRAPLARDPDRHPFRGHLKSHFSAPVWDRYDKSFFSPASRYLALDVGVEAANVNALDEVPDSSWFENRIRAVSASTEAMARGPCVPPVLDGSGPWNIVSGKPDGANPGFIIETTDGQRYLLKFDRGLQAPRAIIADVVASRIYYAAGFDVPCNSVVDFDRSILRLAPNAKVTRATGETVPMTWEHVDLALGRAGRSVGARYRAMASRFLAGKPLGTWQYEGRRRDDRNDIVPHEDRRELRGARLLAAWTAHWDHREQNTLAMWIETSNGLGFVRHHLLDFGDCFGAMGHQSPQSIWRRGHTHWFEPGQVFADYVTLGLIERPWDRAELGPTGLVFGYYDVAQFDPESWTPSYPNPAFQRMTERDAAWMARIISRFEPAHVEAIVGQAPMAPALHDELVRVLLGRREKILERYLAVLSPLADATLVNDRGRTRLCATDLASAAGVAVAHRTYSARAWLGPEARPMPPPALTTAGHGRVCVVMPADPQASVRRPSYWRVDIATQDAPVRPYPARFHLYHWGGSKYLLVGLERPNDLSPPD